MKKYLSLVLWIIVIQSVSMVSGYLNNTGVDTWYQEIAKSPLTPPDIVFPIVWTILYTFIAIAGWMLWQIDRGTAIAKAKTFFIIQLLFNWSWTPVFFYLQQPGYAVAILAGILIFTLLTIIYSYRECKTVSWILMPYFAWGLFAGYLNLYIWHFN